MAIELIAKIKQKNNGTFFLVDAADVEYNGKSIIDALKAGEIVTTGSGSVFHVANATITNGATASVSALTPGSPKAGDIIVDVTGKWFQIESVSGDTFKPGNALTAADGSEISMKGPKGDQGEVGPTGAPGAKGDKGDNGLSAYQVWLAQDGNAGKTEEQFIAALKGAKGDKGEQGAQGVQGPAGAAFSIAKTYASVDAMNAGYVDDGVKVGQFVLIDTGNVNDEDNAKLYAKGDKAYTYITDLSGAAGMTGPQGPQGIQGPQGEKGADGKDGAAGAKGEKGDPGAAGADGKTPEMEIRDGHLYAIYAD